MQWQKVSQPKYLLGKQNNISDQITMDNAVTFAGQGMKEDLLTIENVT